MKDNGIKISRGLESLIKKREVISVDTPEKEEEPVAIEPEKETVKPNSILNRLTIIKDVEEDDEEEEEIETLVSEEIRPSFLDRIQSVKKEEAKSTNEDDVVKKETVLPSFVDRMKSMKKEEIVPTNVEDIKEEVVEEQKLSYEELKEKYEHTMSLNLRSIKLIDKYEAELAKKNKTIARQNEIIAKQKDLIEKFRKTQGLKKRK